VPRYDYHCRECHTTFELTRPMSEAREPATCPDGHGDTVKMLSQVAFAGSPASTWPPSKGALKPQPVTDKGYVPRSATGCCGGRCK
jgi:putative FmdB family regulatory protein